MRVPCWTFFLMWEIIEKGLISCKISFSWVWYSKSVLFMSVFILLGAILKKCWHVLIFDETSVLCWHYIHHLRCLLSFLLASFKASFENADVSTPLTCADQWRISLFLLAWWSLEVLCLGVTSFTLQKSRMIFGLFLRPDFYAAPHDVSMPCDVLCGLMCCSMPPDLFEDMLDLVLLFDDNDVGSSLSLLWMIAHIATHSDLRVVLLSLLSFLKMALLISLSLFWGDDLHNCDAGFHVRICVEPPIIFQDFFYWTFLWSFLLLFSEEESYKNYDAKVLRVDASKGKACIGELAIFGSCNGSCVRGYSHACLGGSYRT